MSRRVAVIVGFLILLTAVGLIVTYLQKLRLAANLTASQNNLRQLALFAAHYANRDPQKEAGIPREIPAATIVLPGVPPENRLSWVVYVLPALDQKRQDTVSLITQINDREPWNSERNQLAARTRLVTVLNPMNTLDVPGDQPAIANYVGIAGLGTDAATLALPPTGRATPRAGAWRYDAATPFDRIDDGLSQTLLMGETSNDLGPWLRGGPSTTRGLDDAAGAKPLIGVGGQFGGYFPSGANFAMCDGSVRLYTPNTSPEVLFGRATIAGGEKEMLPAD
jgi:prepilin-type processing-associated H-X9-DG protein